MAHGMFSRSCDQYSYTSTLRTCKYYLLTSSVTPADYEYSYVPTYELM